MKFYERGNAFQKVRPDTFPAICLRNDNWNDFGFYTYYYVDYYDEEENVTELGGIRILDKQDRITRLPTGDGRCFEALDSRYCSAGSRTYYRGLKAISEKLFRDVLTSLRDCVYDKTIYEEFKEEEGFRTSINRDGMYDDVKRWFDLFSVGETYEPEDFSFTFYTPINAQGDGEMEIKLDFRPFQDPKYGNVHAIPNRVNLLVGKNGCGKTTALSRLANYFARLEGLSDQKIEGCSMMFDKVLVISYSLFDSFAKPFEILRGKNPEEHEDTDVRSLNNYVYCGLIGKNGIMSIEDMKDNVRRAQVLIRQKGRKEFWEKQAKKLLPESLGEDVLRFGDLKAEDYDKLKLSSGQYFLFSIISELIANIDENSVVLIDEPEMHLHPNAVSNLVKIIYEILDEYKSYAVMATHSPVILQEVPSRYIAHVIRDGRSTYTVQIPIETFGCELSAIVDTVFEVDMVHSNYKNVLERLAESLEYRSENTYKRINQYFDRNLSFQARMFLRSLIDERRG